MMKQQIYTRMFAVSLVYVGLCASPGIAAAPDLYTSCEISRGGVRGMILFDKSCSNAWVFPNPVSPLKVTAATISISDSQCGAIEALEKAALGEAGDVLERQRRRDQLTRALVAKTQEVEALDEKVRQFERAEAVLVTRIDTAEAELATKEAEFQQQCPDGAGSLFVCLNIKGQITELKGNIEQDKLKQSRIVLFLNGEREKLRTLNEDVRALETEISQLEDLNVSTDTAEQTAAKQSLLELQSQSGAVLSLTLTTDLGAILETLQAQNRGRNISFSQMRWMGGSLHMAPLSSVEVPEADGYSELSVPGLIEGDGTLFVNASGAKLNLDAVSACRAFSYKRPDPANLRELARNLAANVVGKAYLNYSALVGAKIIVRFDYEKFYEYLVNTESKNGFFKSKTIKEVSERLTAEQQFTVTIVDTGNVLDDETKAGIVQAMKNGVLQRALDALQAKYVGVDPSANPTAPQVGAPVLSAELRKCPNVWCQVGAAVVDVGHAIFGGASQRQSFVQSLNVSLEETYEESKALPLWTDLTFAPR